MRSDLTGEKKGGGGGMGFREELWGAVSLRSKFEEREDERRK